MTAQTTAAPGANLWGTHTPKPAFPEPAPRRADPEPRPRVAALTTTGPLATAMLASAAAVDATNAAPKPRKPSGRKGRQVDIDALVIEDTPLPTKKSLTENKYTAKFQAMKLGQCVRCEPLDTHAVAGALRVFIKAGKLEADVKMVSRCDDGHGRVWMMAKPEKKTKPK